MCDSLTFIGQTGRPFLVRYTDNSYVPSTGLMRHINDVKSETIEFSGQTLNIYLRFESSGMLRRVNW
jgi:hypothetical protein